MKTKSKKKKGGEEVEDSNNERSQRHGAGDQIFRQFVVVPSAMCLRDFFPLLIGVTLFSPSSLGPTGCQTGNSSSRRQF